MTTNEIEMKWIWLSHPLNVRTPSYGGRESFIQEAVKTIARGDTCNTSRWRFSNHLGTHIDFPKHFFKMGCSLESYPPEFWHFRKIAIAHCPIPKTGRWIGPAELKAQVPQNAEILFVRTGFERFRGHRRYWEDSPGLAPEVALWLRKERSSVRTVGMDFISVSRWRDRERGRAAHRAFLSPRGLGKPVLLIEDMSLKEISPNTIINQMFICPLRVSAADGTPCTVLAEVRE